LILARESMPSVSRDKPQLLSRLESKKHNLLVRSEVLRLIRAFFHTKGFVEIETPLLLSTVAPEEHIEPFAVEGRYLAASPELQMKQLVSAGWDKLFQIAHSFRKGEKGRLHNPEFIILEWYRLAKDLEELMEDMEQLFLFVAKGLGRKAEISFGRVKVDLSPPWERVSVTDAFLQFAGWDPVAEFDQARFDVDLVTKIEPRLGFEKPIFLHSYPAAAASLAALCPDRPETAMRVELYVAGLELANGFFELRDPAEQRERFEKARERIRESGRIPPPLSEEFISCLEHMPPCAGAALGVDRMVMLFCNASSMNEVMAFDWEEC